MIKYVMTAQSQLSSQSKLLFKDFVENVIFFTLLQSKYMQSEYSIVSKGRAYLEKKVVYTCTFVGRRNDHLLLLTISKLSIQSIDYLSSTLSVLYVPHSKIQAENNGTIFFFCNRSLNFCEVSINKRHMDQSGTP